MDNKPYKLSKIPHEVYHKHREHFDKIGEIFEHLKKTEQVTEEEIIDILKRKHLLHAVPLSIFSGWHSPLESLVFYMKDIMKLSFAQIAKMLNRNHRTVWLTYRNAKEKNMQLTVSGDNYLPVDIFSNRKLSVLENIAVHLHESKALGLSEIANLLSKDARTIWTVYSRAKKKRGMGK